jgi:hypothetical protein
MTHITDARTIIGMVFALFFGLGMNIFLRDTAVAQTASFLISPYFGTAIITQGWKPSSNPSHEGYDFLLVYEPLIAAGGGIVGFVGWQNNACHHYNGLDPNLGVQCGFGLYTRIDHSNNHSTYYAHMSSVAFGLTNTGVSSVSSGQMIGTSGATGWTIGNQPNTPGPHLHFELRNANNIRIDPFAPNLWKDGQWANPSRPIPAPHSGEEIIVEDSALNAGGFSKGGGGIPNNSCQANCQSWIRTTTASGIYMYSTPADRGTNSLDQWARWQPPLPTYEGVYEILVHVPNQNAATWQAPYVIVHRDGTSSAVVDQFGLSNRWVSIGTYRMAAGDYVYTHDATGEAWNQHCTGWCSLGVDAVKFVRRGTTYAPDIRQGNGWSSTFSVRSNGGDARITFNLFDGNGVRKCYGTGLVAAHASIPLACSSISGEHSLVVDGSQDLSVAVETIYSQSGRFLADMYPGVTSSRIGTTMYAPLILRNWLHLNSSWRQTTNLYIHNPSPQSASVTVTFYDSYGTTGSSHAESRTIPAGGSVTIAGTVLPIWEGGSINGSLASARITSNVPVAVVVRNLVGTSNNGVITTPYLSASYRGFAASEAGSILYYPLAANQWVGAYDSGFQIQNISSSPKTVTVRFYKEGDPNPQGSAVNLNIGAYQSANVWRPSGLPQLYGSAIAEVSGGGNDIVAVAQYEDTRISQSKYGLTLYEAVSNNNRSLVVPRFRRTSPWDWTGVIAQNMSGATNGVTLAFYNMSGSLNTSQSKSGVLNRTSTLFFNEIPTIDGSAQVASTYPFGLMVNVSRRDLYTNQDIMMGYSAVK